ncbi:efflux RND transporter periplasmic adaptor subunit [Desulfohalobium retbaense]|uniref:Efflux transporter, RND family, MFP subunit n=1 Tax=Desulfohalobium retbaense (strain ATCC 49708 / DSM 5692 / JCM 16813 / HR100) TaxID=485915 RepID=C8WZN3_DESRD|nr:efflux RND transporter periplasmic adaptor subunit [Desulfohalobium retbaense]ACV67508.1 efflux transporter, RND family, MFP subunit [Desulfohalobium retbaense DSM 5692]
MNLRNLLSTALGIAILAGLVLYTGGFFESGGISPDSVSRPQPTQGPTPSRTATAHLKTISQTTTAPGTVAPRTTMRVEAQVAAQITSIAVTAGDRVSTGETLIQLEHNRLDTAVEQARQHLVKRQSQLDQARENLPAAQAEFNATQAQWRRIKTYFKAEAATKQELEQARAAFHRARSRLTTARKRIGQAAAGVEVARQKLRAARIKRGYARLTAPADGQVAKRLADPGDQARPGTPLLVLHTDRTLRLEARVPESRLAHVRQGHNATVHIPALPAALSGTIEEIIPSADPRTRTFTVKVALPDYSGLQPGMFGRLEVASGTRQAVFVPEGAVRPMGQLDIVRVRQQQGWQDILVTTGVHRDEMIEILSGVAPGDEIALAGGGHGT